MVTLTTLSKMKSAKEKIACLTTYDASFATIVNEAGVDVILVGDTLGMVFQGQKTTVPVKVSDIVYHTQCVARTNQKALLIGDFPFMSYHSIDEAYNTAKQLMQAGAQMIKLEGHGEWVETIVKELTIRGIPVCAHLGLYPQAIHQLGGYKVQGRDAASRKELIKAAKKMQTAGARLLVLECIPSSLAKEITDALTVPTIGIGAGSDCDGQILVLYDMLGITSGKVPSFSKNFLAEKGGDIQSAISSYVQQVKQGDFPAMEHQFKD